MNEDIDQIKIVDKASGFDLSKYEGKRVKITKVTQIEAIDYYPDGETFDKNSQEKVMKLEIETDALKELDANGNNLEKDLLINSLDGSSKIITVTARLPLQPITENGKKSWVISKHPKAKAWAFMRKMGANKPSDLIGKYVTLTLVPSTKPGDDRKFLRIVM